MDLRDRIAAMLADVALPVDAAPYDDTPVGGYTVYRGEAIGDDDGRPAWLREHHAAVEGGRKWQAIWRVLRR